MPGSARNVTQLTPLVRCILAPNPSPMTADGTNTYLVGTTDIAVIDPGPMSMPHMQAIMDAVSQPQRITHIIVTHTHLDHSPLARPLAEKTGAPVFAFGDATAGRSTVMSALVASGSLGGGEGIDATFVPDMLLADGDRLTMGELSLEVLHTPGHLGNHICLAFGDMCFSGDHVMGWASTLISPPDGDLTDFMRSCQKLRSRKWTLFFPGHGAPVEEPAARLDWLIAHRRGRENDIRSELEAGAMTAHELAARIYHDTPSALLPAAERNVLAHLIDLLQREEVRITGTLTTQSSFRLT